MSILYRILSLLLNTNNITNLNINQDIFHIKLSLFEKEMIWYISLYVGQITTKTYFWKLRKELQTITEFINSTIDGYNVNDVFLVFAKDISNVLF